VEKINIKQVAKKEQVARGVEDYLLFVVQDNRKAIELAAECTELYSYQDWWWKDRLARGYFRLGMYKEAE
jgi:hypothetical protein